MHIPSILLLPTIGFNQFTEAQNRVVIGASTALDSGGTILLDTRIAVSGSKIVAIDPKASPLNYDLRGLTLMSRLDRRTCTVTSNLGPDGKNAGMGVATSKPRTAPLQTHLPRSRRVHHYPNYRRRWRFARRQLAGGCQHQGMLSVVDPLVGRGEQAGTPDGVRVVVRKPREAGADFLKIQARKLAGPFVAIPKDLSFRSD